MLILKALPSGVGGPQLWNGYSYARDSPLTYFDPDGRAPLPGPLRRFIEAMLKGGFSSVDVQKAPGRKLMDNLDVNAITVGYKIFLSEETAEAYDKRNLYGIVKRAHELSHVVDYSDQGVISFGS